MKFFTNISENFKIIRTSHNLSISEISTLLGLKTKSVIGNIETSKGLPSLNLLFNTSSKFAVSIDWLLNLSSIPYTEESVSFAEKVLFETIDDIDRAKITNTMFSANFPLYLDSTSRKENYSLSVRANIVFLLYVSYLKSLTNFWSYQDNPASIDLSLKRSFYNVLPNFLKSKLEPSSTSEIIFDISSKKEKYLYENLSKLLSMQIKNPIFDITKEPSE